MSVEGHLTEVGMLDVLRLMCLSFRPKELTVMRGGETGRLVVDGGQILYARVGRLAGEEAVVELLRWREGIFKVIEVPGLFPERNVQAPLTELLVRATRAPVVPEREPSQVGFPRLSPGAAHDVALDAALVDLFSRLEREVARLEGLRGARMHQAVAVFEDLLARIIDTGTGHLSQGFGAAELRELLARQAGISPALGEAGVEAGKITLAPLRERLARPTLSDAQRAALFTELSGGVLGLVNALFSRLVRSLEEDDLRQQWEETREAFLTDLIAALDAVQH